MRYTNRVVDFVEGLRYSDLPPSVVRKTKECVLDLVGVALAGANTRASTIAKAFAFERFGDGDATVFGEARKTSCVGAAWANSIAACTLDLDDGHNLAVGHPGSAIIPGALALAESRGAGGKDLILAIVLGYETSVRIAGSRVPSYIHTYASGPWGVYGAAIAAAKLLGLDQEKIIHAIGVAGSHGPARPHSKNYEFVPMLKEAIGWAGMTGVSSALLAEKGFTGFMDFMDYEEFFDGQALTGTLGKEYEILKTWFKPYTACRWTHSSIDAVLQLRKEHGIKPEEVKDVRIRSFERASIMGQKRPISSETAQYSIPYCVGAALCDGKVGPDQVAEERIGDPKILDVAAKVRLVYDEEMQLFFRERFPAIVEIETSRGVFSVRVESPKGDDDNPFTEEELEAKFEDLAPRVLGKSVAEELKSRIKSLESVDNVGQITELLRRR